MEYIATWSKSQSSPWFADELHIAPSGKSGSVVLFMHKGGIHVPVFGPAGNPNMQDSAWGEFPDIASSLRDLSRNNRPDIIQDFASRLHDIAEINQEGNIDRATINETEIQYCLAEATDE